MMKALLVLAVVLIIGWALYAFSSRPESSGGERSAERPKAAAVPDPLAQARDLAAREQYEAALTALGDNQGPEAEELLLALVKLPETPARHGARKKASEALGRWRSDHERIASVLLAQLALPGAETGSIVRTLADWNMKQHAPALAEFLVGCREWSSWRPAAESLRRIATPECVPILLKALPPPPARGPTGREPDSKEFYETRQRALPIFEILGDLGDERAVPAIIPYLNVAAFTDTWRPAAIALGKIGTEEALSAIEQRLQNLTGDYRQLFLAGLLRAPHPRGRKAREEALAGTDWWARAETADALAEIARPEDAACVLLLLGEPDPLIKQRVLPSLPRLLPACRLALEQAYKQAMDTQRYRTALLLAEALADAPLIAEAKDKLDRLRAAIWQEPRLDRWLGMKKEDFLTQYPQAHIQPHVRTLEAPTQIIWVNQGSTLDAAEVLQVWGGRECAGPFVGVTALRNYPDAAYGVRIGDSTERAWQLHGASERDRFCYMLTGREGVALTVGFAFGKSHTITAISVRQSRP